MDSHGAAGVEAESLGYQVPPRSGQLRQGCAGGPPAVRNADEQLPCKPLFRG